MSKMRDKTLHHPQTLMLVLQLLEQIRSLFCSLKILQRDDGMLGWENGQQNVEVGGPFSEA
jgi:hypothetical protein